ncbi:MAG: hypothetical protein WD356_02475 [Pseudomonadales bacterium]
MRALAEFVMRGRPQAIGVSVLAAPLPLLHLLSTSVASLVLLRRGLPEGLLVIAWTCLPLAVIYTFSGDPGPIITLLGTAVLAHTLRTTMSWKWVLVGAVPIAGVGAWVFSVIATDLLDIWVQWYQELTGTMEATEGVENVRQVLIGFFAMGQAFVMLGLLALARWWQSELYNPGGFSKEFHQLRLLPPVSAVIVVLMVGCALSDIPELARWLPVLTVPLVMAALGLAHWAISYNELSTGWVVGFYILLMLVPQLVYPLLVAGALMDSGLDLRKRFQKE